MPEKDLCDVMVSRTAGTVKGSVVSKRADVVDFEGGVKGEGDHKREITLSASVPQLLLFGD